MALVFEMGSPPRLSGADLQEVHNQAIAQLIVNHDGEFRSILGKIYNQRLRKEMEKCDLDN